MASQRPRARRARMDSISPQALLEPWALSPQTQRPSRDIARFATQNLFPACDGVAACHRRQQSRFAACASARRRPVARPPASWGRRVDIGTCHDASTSARLTGVPRAVIPPRDSVSPAQALRGAGPHRAANDGAPGTSKVARLGGRQERWRRRRPLHRAQRVDRRRPLEREAASTTLRSSSLLASPRRSPRPCALIGASASSGLDRPFPPPVRLGPD